MVYDVITKICQEEKIEHEPFYNSIKIKGDTILLYREKLVKGTKSKNSIAYEHYIEWIQIIADGAAYRKFLKPADKPQAEFEVKADKIESREYCNVNGLWKS